MNQQYSYNFYELMCPRHLKFHFGSKSNKKGALWGTKSQECEIKPIYS